VLRLRTLGPRRNSIAAEWWIAAVVLGLILALSRGCDPGGEWYMEDYNAQAIPR